MNKRAVALFFGLLAIFAGAWMNYVVGDEDGCVHMIAQITAGAIVFIGIMLVVMAFCRNRHSLISG